MSSFHRSAAGRGLLLAVAALAVLLGAGQASAVGTLYGIDRAGTLFTIDLASGAGTLVGGGPGSTEIEFNPGTGQLYSQQPDGAFTITEIDILTGAALGAPVFTGIAFNGLEYIGGSLYGTGITGPGFPSILDPVSGISVPIGATGVGPIAGLAYDEFGAILYGIAGGAGPADLFTLDLATGMASLVGSTGIQAGSLEFGPDGRLYAGGTGPDSGLLYTIDTSSGASTLLGATGFGSTTGLTSTAPPIPEPSSVVLLALGSLVVGRALRGRSRTRQP